MPCPPARTCRAWQPLALATTVVVACLALPLPAVWSQETLRREVLDRVKQASVYIQARRDERAGTGSGFFCHKTSSHAYVATNAHVVTFEKSGDKSTWQLASRIVAVLHSGTPRERAVPAEVVALDPAEDLAVLRIAGTDFPEPLPLRRQGSEVFETQTVYVFGFPFGGALAVGEKNPAITVSKAAVSSVRRDANQDVAVIQVDGSINPGNSGGPVVTRKGQLVGVTVAKVKATQIGFTIPADKLRHVLTGTLSGLTLKTTGTAAGQLQFQVEGLLLDPLQRIRQVVMLGCREKDAARNLKPTAAGTWRQVATKFQSIKMQRTGSTVRGEFSFPVAADGEQVYYLQPAFLRGDKSRVFLQPGRLVIVPVAGGSFRARLTAADGETPVSWFRRVDREPPPKVAGQPDPKRPPSPSPPKPPATPKIVRFEPRLTIDGLADKLLTASVSPDGRLVATAGLGAVVQVWDLASGKLRKQFSGGRSWIWSVSFSPDGKRLAAACGFEKQVRIWDVASGRETQLLKGHRGKMRGVTYAPKGSMMATSGDDKVVRLWNPATGKTTRQLTDHEGIVAGVAFSPDGRWLASGSGDRTARVWHVESGNCVNTLGGNDKMIWNLAFDPISTRLATTCADQFIKMWELPKGELSWKFHGSHPGHWAITFSPDARLVVANSGPEIVVLDAETGKQLQVLRKHTGDVRTLAFTPDGRTLVSASDDKTVVLWDVR